MAGQLGYCGLDPRRQPLTGEEIRGCWEGWPAGATTTVHPLTIVPARTSGTDRRPLEFVEVASMVQPSAPGDAAEPVPGGASPAGEAAPPIGEPRWNLWGDADR